MGLAKLSDGTPGVQKQKGEKKWTKKGAAIVAELLKTRTDMIPWRYGHRYSRT